MHMREWNLRERRAVLAVAGVLFLSIPGAWGYRRLTASAAGATIARRW